jgi:hypothetical protein
MIIRERTVMEIKSSTLENTTSAQETRTSVHKRVTHTVAAIKPYPLKQICSCALLNQTMGPKPVQS